MQRKAVFLDVDGTYVNDRGLVPDSAHQAVVRARANGHLVFLCTGRSTAMVPDHVMAAGFDGVIASAGGYVELRGEVLQHRSMPVEDVRHVVEFFDAHDVAFILEANSGIYGSRDSKSRLRGLIFGGVTDASLLAELEKGLSGFIDAITVGADLLRSDINKVSFFGSALPLGVVGEEFWGALTVIPRTVPRFGPASGELSIPGVHKAQGIELLLTRLGLPQRDTIAYGDGLNDLEMLRYVHTGVAMASAHAQVRAASDTDTGDPDDDGIATSFAALGLI